MEKASSTLFKLYKPNDAVCGIAKAVLILFLSASLSGCELIKMKGDDANDGERHPAAKANGSYLYKEELVGIVAPGTPPQDSARLIEAYINSWIRKQLLIQEAARKMDINEAEVERKILDYRYSIIAYEYQTFYIKQNLDTVISTNEVNA